MMMEYPPLEIRGISKSYGPVQAVKDLTLRVNPGEIYGFLGLNGAGKTTTIRMILGLVHPEAGELLLFGKPLARARHSTLGRLGSLVETASAYPNLTVRENLDLQCQLLGLPTSRSREVLSLLGLDEYKDRKAGTLSLGNKQRLSLARALLPKPELLILDEPVNGLDPAGIAEVRKLLLDLAEREGTAILMSSHHLEEVRQVSHRIGIIHQGSLIKEFQSEELKAAASRELEVETADPDASVEILKNRYSGVLEIQKAGSRLVLSPRSGAEDSWPAPWELADLLVRGNQKLLHISQRTTTLEELFLHLTGGKP